MAAEEDRAMPLFAADPDSGELRLQEATLERVLLSDQLRDSPVIPVSITGAFRRGKSFLLNVLLRYLRSQSAGGGGDWLEDAPLTGFPWRGGRQAHTRDLQLWSRPLPVTLADGRTAHVLLVDSQGAFDNVSTPTESVVMRALAGLLSGVQVLNVSRQPQSDDLQQARLCAEYARLLASAAGAPHRTPRLVLLVRDWAFPAEEPYGAEGGRHILGHWLAGGDIEDGGDGTDIDTVADGGLAAEELECFLLPHPGAAAAGGDPEFSGAASQLAPEFAEQLREFAEWLLDAARLPVREIDGRPLTGAALAALCRSLSEHAARLPPQLEAAADHLAAAAARRAVQAALRSYTARLEEATAAEPLSETTLQQVHREAESEARQTLVSCPGVDHLSEAQTIRPLAAAIQEHWERIRGLNSERLQLRAAQADSHNAALAEASSAAYESAMLAALPADGPSVTDVRLSEAHAAAVRAALQHFDNGRDGAGPAAEQQRSALCGRLEGQLAGHRTRNAALRQQEAVAAAELTRQAVARAQTQYQQQMVAAGELAEPALRQAHQAAAAAATATAGAAGQAQLSGWLAAQLEPRLQAARQREKQELERKQAEAQAQLQAAQAICGPRHRGITIRIGKKKFSIR
ncbi:atlastin-3-like [Amphibalanus amphitrite]|uniref:atlastin-3-like n=1 Tax=Amphibalanus amphitrite TaxID=1232801 RepID=UPI001C918AFE|nr:atlastin-3-like [Amphibalanus amphitrite]